MSGKKSEKITAAPAEETALTTPPAGSPPVASEYGDDAGLGAENFTSAELLIPFFRILQGLSPQLDESAPEYVEGARQGMILNTATGALYDGKIGVGFVPCYREHRYLEWVPREAGGGLVGVWEVSDARLAALKKEHGSYGKLPLASGNQLVETFSLFGVFTHLTGVAGGAPAVDESQPFTRGVISFSSTGIKSYKKMSTRLNELVGVPARAPLFAWNWVMGTVMEQNTKGKFYSWRPGLLGGSPTAAQLRPTAPLYRTARDFYLSLRDGAARADYAGSTGDGDEEIPF